MIKFIIIGDETIIKEKNRKLNIKLLLVAILLFVTVGYATLNTNLTINGTSKINNSTWDVHFDDVNITPGSVLIDTDLYEAAQEAKIDPNDETKVTYNVLLSKPGDPSLTVLSQKSLLDIEKSSFFIILYLRNLSLCSKIKL